MSYIYSSYVTNYAGGADVNSAEGNVGAELLIANITDARSTFGGLGLPTTLPIGTADAGSYFNNEVLQSVDYGVRRRIVSWKT